MSEMGQKQNSHLLERSPSHALHAGAGNLPNVHSTRCSYGLNSDHFANPPKETGS
jgi:hypothetical protein